MELLIDNRSGVPIYEQICTQLRGQIVSDALPADTPLPSIRSLAKDLGISVITTKRAYDELEAAGFIYTVAGKGCFVAPKNLELLREENLKQLEQHLLAARALARQCGIGSEELLQTIHILFGGEEI